VWSREECIRCYLRVTISLGYVTSKKRIYLAKTFQEESVAGNKYLFV